MTATLHMQTPDQMLHLLNDLVSYKSITLSEEEKHIPLRIQQHILRIPYFEANPGLVDIHITTDSRFFLTALYKREGAKKTVIMVSHFDVVDVEDYGKLKHLACLPEELTKELKNHPELLSPEARLDLESGDWIFGRGTMDMKCGIVQHISLLERASAEDWNVNLLLLSVPDEEVNSVGMREAIPKLLELAETHSLDYTLFLNSEPMFTQNVHDENHYFYTGSIGKILPGIFCYGKETHVGEPLSGVNAAWMSSMFTQEMEWNELLCESVNGQSSPPPTILWQKDLKKEYSAQIPDRSVSLYNAFLMNRNPAEIMDIMVDLSTRTAKKMEASLQNKFLKLTAGNIQPPKIKVITYKELKQYAIEKTSETYIASLEHSIAKERKGDNRVQSIDIVDQLATICKELAPMAILFFAPPYYPAVNTEEEPVINELSASLIDYAKKRFGYDMQPVSYFNGISDLSYATLQASIGDMETFNANLPGDNELYDIPFRDIARFNAPVLNVGPIGKDAHKQSERLYLPFAFGELPHLLTHIIKLHEKQTV